jgi:Flp pilus assembly protein CpaB
MTTTRSRNTIIAASFAVLATIFTALYAGSGKSSAKSEAPLGTVLVATRDIPVGTPGAALLSRHLVATKSIDASALEPGAVKSAASLAGLVSVQPILLGDQLKVRRFAQSRGNATLAGLRGNQRAISIAGDSNQLLADTLRDGDRVDVLASVRVPEQTGPHISRIVLRGLTVLQAPSASDSATQNVSAMLALTDEQAQKLFYVMKNGDWSLVLRPGVRASDRNLPGQTAASITRSER